MPITRQTKTKQTTQNVIKWFYDQTKPAYRTIFCAVCYHYDSTLAGEVQRLTNNFRPNFTDNTNSMLNTGLWRGEKCNVSGGFSPLHNPVFNIELV